MSQVFVPIAALESFKIVSIHSSQSINNECIIWLSYFHLKSQTSLEERRSER
jgi:hypothetical protein